MRNKQFWGVIILLVVIFTVIFFSSCNSCSDKKVVKDPCAEQNARLIKSRDSLQVLYNECMGIEVISDQERIRRLEEQIKKFNAQPPRSYSKTTTTTRRRSTPKPDVEESSFSGSTSQFKPSTFQKSSTSASDVNSGLKINYAGQIPSGSKAGTVVTPDRFVLYYIKDSYLRENGMTAPAPRLYGTNGPEFTLDASQGYWFYVDASTLMTPSTVNNWSHMLIWSVYIGRVGTWDAYLPHESLKAEMKRVRGREDGAITMEELLKMHQTNSEIWTDQNLNGLLMPKSFNPISGEQENGSKIGPEDGKVYQGWDFRTRITGTVETARANGDH